MHAFLVSKNTTYHWRNAGGNLFSSLAWEILHMPRRLVQFVTCKFATQAGHGQIGDLQRPGTAIPCRSRGILFGTVIR